MKFKLDKKSSKKIIAFLLATTTFLTGFTGCKKRNTTVSESEIITEFKDDTLDSNLQISTNSIPEEPTINEQVESNEFIDEILNVNVNYNYPEYYFDDSDYQELLKEAASLKECENSANYNWHDIYIAILTNSNIYESRDEIDKDIKSALSDALDNLFYDNNNVGDDFCKLKDITIKIESLEDPNKTTVGRYINDENVILIDYYKIKTSYEELEEKYDLTFKDYLTQVLQHELNHARQYICTCRENQGQINNMIRYDYNDNKNTFGSIIEASAESQIYNRNVNELKSTESDTVNYTYYDERKSQSMLLLMGLFKENFSIDKYYQAIFDSDLPALFDLFELKTEDDFINFYNIMYAMDSLNGRTLLSKDIYDAGYITVGDQKEQVGNDYKVAIFKSVSIDLIEKISEEELSLEESLELYFYIKANVLNDEYHLEKINDEYLYLYNNNLIDGIGTIDDIFYKFIYQYYNVNKEDVDNIGNDNNIEDVVGYLCGYFNGVTTYYNDQVYEKTKSLIRKYPLITEISFCNFSYYSDVISFDEARENNLVKEKILK